MPAYTVEASLVLLVCYLIGAVPSAYIMGKLVKNLDIRNHGSGNVGFTNALRVLGVVPGIITLLMDIGKGYLSIFFVEHTYNNLYPFSLEIFAAVAGIVTVCGHIWPVYIGFKGGKGIAVGCGIFLNIALIPTLITTGIWIFFVLLTNIVSISSIAAVISLPMIMMFFRKPVVYVFISVLLAAVVVFMHRSNIKRLLKGEERKFIKKKKK
ncbi:glycerol-3-phosphate 1-O-acyltransferase PlsY [bacterium]|nr:glycerol-3-phosphate 1-O-acyltransferase PlsY [bacterium]